LTKLAELKTSHFLAAELFFDAAVGRIWLSQNAFNQ